MFTQEELKALLALISRVDIKGSEATVVAILQQKINANLQNEELPEKVEEEKQTEEKETIT